MSITMKAGRTVLSGRFAPCPGRPSPRPPRLAQRSAVRVCALLNQGTAAKQSGAEEGVLIPLNYAQLLGLRGRDLYLEPQITGAYDALFSSELEPSYSSVARLGREKLLYAAREGMRVARGRVAASHPDVTVEAVLLPGAMALLEQVGQYELVAELAQAAEAALTGRELRANSRATIRDYQRDVALASSLAQCGLAKAAIDGGRPAQGSARLEEALRLLRQGAAGGAPLAPELQRSIAAALEDLKPDAVVDLLKEAVLPMEAALRRQSLATLSAMLLRPEAVPAAPADGGATSAAASSKITPDYVSSALSCLTSAEICSVLRWDKAAAEAASVAWWHPRLLLQVGTAHLVAGFVQRRPSLVTTAARLLHAARAEADVAVHIAVCEVLLGQPYEALDTLREDEQTAAALRGNAAADLAGNPKGRALPNSIRARSTSARREQPLAFPDRDGVMGFVRSASPEGDADLLPGLCIFAEQWLQRVAFPQVRDTREAPPSASLAAYFEDPKIESFLDSRGASTGLLAAIRSFAAAVSTSAAGGATAAGRLLASGLALPARAVQSLRAAAAAGTPRSLAYAVGVMAVSGAVLLGANGFSSRRHARRQSTASAAPAAVIAAGSAQRASSDLTKGTAERVVKQWLDIKAEAMGPRHNTARLSAVLAEPMLQAVMSEAKEAAASGWFWNIRPLKVRVDSIDGGNLTPEGGFATVTATVDESADLWATNGKKGDAYKTTYRVEYSMVRSGGGWKVASALVLGR